MPFSLTSEGRSLSNLFHSNEPNSENLLVEKHNLLCVFKLVMKDLLNSSLRHERLLENEYFPLKHFFIVFEHILFHGYTGKKSFAMSSSSIKKDPWPIIELISRKSPDTHTTEISVSSKEMTNIRTPLGRVRAWLRLALMQKRLADYFRILVEHKQELQELYDSDALLLSDEMIIITGLLVGLNVLDFNLCLKETVLDLPLESPIHYSLYLRERRITSISSKNAHPPGAIQDPIDELDDYSSMSSMSSSPMTRTVVQDDDTVVVNSRNDVISLDETNGDSSYDQRVSSILDQKNYLEELNRNLQKTVAATQERLQLLEQTNKILAEGTAMQNTRIEQLEKELAKVTGEKEQIQSSYQRKIETLNSDIEVERDTYQKSRAGFDSIYNDLQKKFEDERSSKQKIESVYQTQINQNNDLSQSTKTLEKDIEVKTTLYDRMKEENRSLTSKLQLEMNRNTQKDQQIQTTDKENQVLRRTINELETNIEQIHQEIQTLSKTSDELVRKLNRVETEKVSLETDLHVEQNFHQQLRKALTNEKEKVSSLQFDVHDLNVIKQEYESYKTEMTKKQIDLGKKFQEQEETIEELALKLEAVIKREDATREKEGGRTSTWMKDENVKECCQCKKDFSPLRRKHHCRKCGQIFCEACVNTKLVLSGSTKPVRVCDMCRNDVLAQCAVNP